MARDPGTPIISISFLIGIASIVACLLLVFITIGSLVVQAIMMLRIILVWSLGFMRLRLYGLGLVMQNTSE